MSNLAIWDALKKTDPAHTKKFKRAGGFSGTSVKPIYMTQKMTGLFGPAGSGWGMGEPKFDVVSAGDEILVYCTGSIWWTNPAMPEERYTVYGVGGDKVVTKRSSGPFCDDEAFKKAYTDAMSNAMKQIGMAADIHMGQHDDDKYVQKVAREIAAGAKANKWAGPLSRTALNDALHKVSRDVTDCNDEASLDDILKAANPIIKQAMTDWPVAILGDGGDIQGLKPRAEMMRVQFRTKDNEPSEIFS